MNVNEINEIDNLDKLDRMDKLDNFHDFSLDMVSTDMNFEQVYSMYNNLQQEQALSAVDNLQKMQTMNPSHNMNHQSPFQKSYPSVNSPVSMKAEPETQLQHPQGKFDANMKYVSSDEESDEELDKFFSNTESNALENFLDNLADPANATNPLDMYNYSFNFRKTPVKKEITDAFSHPPLTSLSKDMNLGSHHQSSSPDQLPTPDSRQSSINDDLDEPQRKRKRSTSKPLLSVEQKRLNHSFSEQKRRQLCKLAYERCLKLVTDLETYSKSASNKKSKRKLFTKDGLPNLSKHCALVKISHEITRLKSKNDELRDLLNSNVI